MNPTYKLNSGNVFPMISFGTYLIRGSDLIKTTLDYALAAGYRSIDTASVYNNERHIGNALKDLLPKYKLKREDIWITSKLSPSDQGASAYEALKRSVDNLQCGYLDLYLIHWPGAFGVNASDCENAKLRSESWKALIKGKDDGLTKDIGVSNYLVRHLQEIVDKCEVKPAVNQVEWHPHYHKTDLKTFCEEQGILLQAYSSLGGTNNTNLINDLVVESVANKLNKSPAQVLLRWALQQNVAVVPKARSKDHIENNIDLNFEIPESDMSKLNNLQKGKYSWDPTSIQ